jgi:hypothetical protein
LTPAFKLRTFIIIHSYPIILAAMNCIMHKRFKKTIKRIVEFGCSEMKFFIHMKNGLTDRDVTISLVDIDESTLNSNMSAVVPVLFEHIRQRQHSLRVDVWKGDVSKPNPNFTDVDCVVLLELIEHVYPDVLDEIPFNIFGNIAPKIVIISTPNCEFNKLFEFKDGQVFRHDDHKFEWDREQFRDWCENICERFPNYVLQIEGIGTPPQRNQLETIGCCSQLALFMNKEFINSLDKIVEDESKGTTQKYSDSNDPNLIPCEDYVIMKSLNYPVFIDSRDRKQRIEDEIFYHVSRARYIDDYYNSETYRIEVPMDYVVNCCWEASDDKQEIINVIKEKYASENDLIILDEDEKEEDEVLDD